MLLLVGCKDGFLGVVAFDDTTPSDDEHVPSVEQKTHLTGERGKAGSRCAGIVSEACAQNSAACSKRILSSSSRKYKEFFFIDLFSQLLNKGTYFEPMNQVSMVPSHQWVPQSSALTTRIWANVWLSVM